MGLDEGVIHWEAVMKTYILDFTQLILLFIFFPTNSIIPFYCYTIQYKEGDTIRAEDIWGPSPEKNEIMQFYVFDI